MQSTDILVLLQRLHSYSSTARSSRFSIANMFSRFIHRTKLFPFSSIIRSMASVTWFEIGSLFCAVAPSVNFLIFARAVAGIGGAGSTFISGSCFVFWPYSITVFVSVLSIIGEVTRLEDRPKLFGYVIVYFNHPYCF